MTFASDYRLPSGPAVYFDGTGSMRHAVTVQAAATELRILGADRRVIDEWRYADLRRLSAPEGVLRLGRRGDTLLARLVIRDRGLAAAIEERADTLDRSGAAERALQRKVVGFSLAAIASMFATAIFGVPALTNRLIPFIPLSVERKLGNAVDREVAASLDSRHLGAAFECGAGPGEAPGRAALDRLVGKLAAAAALPFPLHVAVVRRPEANAFALPGGRVYVHEGLIDQAQS